MEIDVKGLTFAYNRGSKQILGGVNMRIDKPGLYCILGPNGVGKSTLIRCIDGILKPSSGSVLVNGKDVSEYSLKELSKIIGYIPVSSTDTFAMTVVDTIMMGRHPHQKVGSEKKDLGQFLEGVFRHILSIHENRPG